MKKQLLTKEHLKSEIFYYCLSHLLKAERTQRWKVLFIFSSPKPLKRYSATPQNLISEINRNIMFINFINRILGYERGLSSNRQVNTTPDVIVEKSSIIPRKYKEDIKALQSKYGDTFKTGLCIRITLKEMLELCPRERRRIDAYRGLVSYLEKNWGIELKITSQKTKL